MSGVPWQLAADIGGTFTDVVLECGARRHSCKVLTTPAAPERGVMQGIARLLAETGVDAAQVGLFIHGTTLATNALIERKGARTAFLTTAGFRDVLEMGHEKRFDHYNIDIDLPPVLVPRPLRFTVAERVAADGAVLRPLDEGAVRVAARAMREQGVEAVAVGFLHAYREPGHELRARALLEEELGDVVTVCLSSEVCPEMREYERFSTTVANAYVRPLMSGYLTRLAELLRAARLGCPLLLMMSGGGLTTLAQAARFPVRLIESGPAGGAVLAAHIARECGLRNVMAFDMGGTTAKVCLIADGTPERSRRFEVGRVWRNMKGSGLPLRIPVIELVEIGAGGGSLGRVDAMGRITVGPDSAGADPGPACYGRGGTLPAVTDANLVLGRIDGERFAAGTLALDAERARAALEAGVGRPIGADAFWAAAGMSEIVEENMANAARVHAIERGCAIEAFDMIAFGGAAPLHAARVAQKLGIRRVIVPAGAGVGSAIGFLRSPIAYEVVRSDTALLDALDLAAVNTLLSAMREEALAAVSAAAGDRPLAETRRAELRYVGQGHELALDVPARLLGDADVADLTARFVAEYRRLYGVSVDGSRIEVVNWSLAIATAAAPVAAVGRVAASGMARASGGRRAWEPARGEAVDFGLHWRATLAAGMRVCGPALIGEDETTSVVPAGWSAGLDAAGNLWLETDA